MNYLWSAFVWSSYHHDDMRSLIFIFIASFITSCDWQSSQRPSVLVIAVEGLSSELFFCDESDAEFTEGLGTLCNESVRFTHAFTPSTMSQASLASLMTGLYPTETGVVQNGAQFLSEKFVTVAEAASDKGYRTSFFSGGAPIWSKSGLDQGFEFFEDNLGMLLSKPYRRVEDNFNRFIEWYDEQGREGPFFSVIYLSDLQYPQLVTVDDFGQERARSREGQLREINESFASLIAKLKQKKIWDNTFVVFTGLNGVSSESRENEIAQTNLHGEGTQVLLMIKPARKSRDLGINWAIDANVSLVDLGATFFDVLGFAPHNESKNETLTVVSLLPSLVKPQVNWSRDRVILIESAWALWRGVGTVRFAIRKNNFLYIQDESPQLYNTLTDRFEVQPFRMNERIKYPVPIDMQNFFAENNLPPWSSVPASLIEKIRLYQAMDGMGARHISRGDIKIRLLRLIQKRPWDKQLVGWFARLAIEEKDWEQLEELGREHLYPIWVYVARRMKGENIRPPPDACWDKLQKKNTPVDRDTDCEDKEFKAFAELVSGANINQKARFEDRFIRAYIYAEIDHRVAALNFQNGLSWDVNVSLPAGPRLIELALLLPEHKSMQAFIEGQLRRY